MLKDINSQVKVNLKPQFSIDPNNLEMWMAACRDQAAEEYDTYQDNSHEEDEPEDEYETTERGHYFEELHEFLKTLQAALDKKGLVLLMKEEKKDG